MGIQGDPKVSERFCEAIQRSLGDLKQKKINSSKKFMQIPLKVYFFEIKHDLEGGGGGSSGGTTTPSGTTTGGG